MELQSATSRIGLFGMKPAPEDTTSSDTTHSVGAPESAPDDAYHVQLDGFEGPLDLLLHLIQQHELDVRDIPIGFVTEKYVEYIKLMQELNIDLASEYLVMAATLAHIKSKTLLPVVPDELEDESEFEGDPRAELVRRLLEYQKYKNAAQELDSRSVLGRDVFPRQEPAPAVEGPAEVAKLNIFKLLDAFQRVLDRARISADHTVALERFSITDRINELSDLLRDSPGLAFEELFQGTLSRAELIVTFLALLEMTRLRLIYLHQQGSLEPLRIELAVRDSPGESTESLVGEIDIPGDDEALEHLPPQEHGEMGSEN